VRSEEREVRRERRREKRGERGERSEERDCVQAKVQHRGDRVLVPRLGPTGWRPQEQPFLALTDSSIRRQVLIEMSAKRCLNPPAC
jgi:hypothetical protein